MKINRTDSFVRQAARLVKNDPKLGKTLTKCVERLAVSLRHPGLRVKRLQSLTGKWEARVNRRIRIIFSMKEDEILLEAIGQHDIVLTSKPSREG